MTHPYALHASGALWSLRTAWPTLTHAYEAARAAEAESGDLGTLRSTTAGSIGGNGHSDRIGDAIARHADSGSTADRYARVIDEVSAEIARLTRHLLDGANGLAALLDAVPTMPPMLAGWLAEAVTDLDRQVRRTVGLHLDDWCGVPELECPACGMAGALALRTSAPPEQRTVVCTHGCLCRGDGCGCGMGVEAERVPHVWTPAEMQAVLDARRAAA